MRPPRWVLTAALVIAVEAYLFRRYSQLGAVFHFWLHGLFGAALGFFALTVVTLVRRRRVGDVWTAGFLGHVYSAAPDVAFLTVGVLHYLWMDVFAFHVSLHFVPAPLVTMFSVFAFSVTAWAAATLGRRRIAAGLLALAVAVTSVALAVRRPIPDTLTELRADPSLALLCPLAPWTVSG